jgi:hypothetical protein
VSTVCPAALLLSALDLNVVDNQLGDVLALDLGVALGILHQVEQELARLLGPANL